MSKIETIVYRCRDPHAQRAFYCDALGMTDVGDGAVGYGGDEAKLVFLPANDRYEPRADDLYWKIALAVPNIELAHQQLTALGVAIDTPRQFQDVGYLTHFKDPHGFTIELIEHWFEGQRQAEPINPQRLGGGAHLNLLTLRTSDIAPIQQACDAWGMTPLSVQPVETYGFTLYFFAFTQERPPSSDLTALANREWLYQRRYTVLEIQHRHQATDIGTTPDGHAGYVRTDVSHAPADFYGSELLRFAAR
ncbi:MAG: VOC family protein [Pseudomonadota bacterium]